MVGGEHDRDVVELAADRKLVEEHTEPRVGLAQCLPGRLGAGVTTLAHQVNLGAVASPPAKRRWIWIKPMSSTETPHRK